MTPRNAFVLALVVLVAFPALASAQAPGSLPAPSRVPPDVATMKLSFAPIVRRAAPAVVNVYSKRVVRQQVDPFWGMFMQQGMSRDRVEQSLGSGSIVRADGVVLTNHHVIDNAQEIMVVTADRREWPATVLLDDPRADLAVLKIDPKGEALPTIAIDDAARPQVGDLVLAIGDPFGVGQTVTNGIVSALARADVGVSDYSFFIQTDASINPGNSGGPLVDMDGDLIGVNTAILSGSGSSAGVGFAIPAAMVKQVVNTALGGGKSVIRPWLGVRTQALTGEMAKSLGLEAPRGVVVTDLWPTGPAARAGVAAGDVIVSIDGQEVDNDAGINYSVGTRPPGETVALVVRRNGGPPRTLSARTEAPPAEPPADARVISGRNPLAGAMVVNASPAAAYQYGFDPFSGRGVLVIRLDAGYGQTIGLRPGDFIREINGVKIDTTRDLVAATTARTHVWSLSIERAGHIITAQFQG
jgi:Do/DeqQ family serine protease